MDSAKRKRGKKIAEAVRAYLDEQKIKRLDFERMIGRSKSTVDKFFSGDFSPKLLVRIEQILGRAFGESYGVAPSEWGGYTKDGTAALQGAYLTLRNDFQDPSKICAYVTRFEWAAVREAQIFDGKLVREPTVTGYGVVFREERRARPEYAHRGQVWIPTDGYVYLLTAYGDGRLRAAIASWPDDGKMTGIQLSKYNPKGNAFAPAASPIIFIKKNRISPEELGDIDKAHSKYTEYQELLAEAAEDVVFAALPLSLADASRS